MKKLFFAFAVSLLSSCAVQTPSMQEWSIDFSKYNSQGFYVSPFSQVEGEYTPISTVGATCRFNAYLNTFSYSEILDKVVDMAKMKGANGLLGVQNRTYSDAQGWCYAEVEGVAVVLGDRPVTSNPHTVYNQEPERKNPLKVENSKYDYEAARKIGKPYIKKMDGEKYYYDPETKGYISKEDFLSKYEELDLLTIEKLHKLFK